MALLANIARASALTLLCGLPAGAQDVADRIFTGGTIVTMDDANPGAEAVAVKDGASSLSAPRPR